VGGLVAALQLSARAGLGAGLSVIVARALCLPFPIYAMIAAVIVTDLSPARTRQLSLQRTAGTVLGAALGAALAAWAASTWAIAAGVAGAMLACHALRMKEAARLAGYVCAIVMLDHAGDPWRYAVLRLVETLIGIAVALLVSLVPKLLRLPREDPPPGH
jgi:uncharacterized membrane protein YgaE (UPF0421/DUF939 family)